MEALVPGRSFGALFYDEAIKQRMTWAGGVFYRGASWGDFDFDTANGIDFAARLTSIPYYIKNTHLVHLGISAAKRLHNNDFEIGTTPETELTATRYVDSGDLVADSTFSIGLEAAWQKGPLAVQAEHIRSSITTEDGTPVYNGDYVYASYFLTGETLPYNSSSGTFGKLVPKRPISRKQSGGRGALQAVIRLSRIDLDSGDFQGGRELNITAGFNWYLTRTMRVMVNYTHGRVDSEASGHFNVLQARYQYSF